MEFLAWDPDLEGRDDVVAVACAVPAALVLSHVPGHTTPEPYRADTSTEAALRYVRDPDADPSRFDVVTCDRFTSDGLLAAWTLASPETALEHRDVIVDAARAAEHRTLGSARGHKLHLVLEGYRRHDESPLSFKLDEWAAWEADEVVYQVLVGMLPNLFDQVGEYEYLWRGAWTKIQDDLDAFEDGRFATRKDGRVTLVEGDRMPDPAATGHAAKGPLYLLACRTGDGVQYRLDRAYHAWIDPVDLPEVPVPDLGDAVSTLQGRETADGRWMTRGYAGAGRTELLRFTDATGTPLASDQSPDDVLAVVAQAVQ